MQLFCMATALQISSRGTITLPIALRRRLKLDRKEHSVLLVEERPDGIFLHPAVTVPVRDIPVRTIKKWVKDDEADAASVKLGGELAYGYRRLLHQRGGKERA
jgi:bifunctional DNA-binding transcriptional regulator/antitoxin component of YhaV-PrlF toxin-antitoxin module